MKNLSEYFAFKPSTEKNSGDKLGKAKIHVHSLYSVAYNKNL